MPHAEPLHQSAASRVDPGGNGDDALAGELPRRPIEAGERPLPCIAFAPTIARQPPADLQLTDNRALMPLSSPQNPITRASLFRSTAQNV